MHGSLLTLILMLLGVGALLAAVTAWVMAWSLAHPPRMSDGKAAWVLKRLSPADVGLAFEEMTFRVRDERGRPLDVSAWWIPHPRSEGRCAVLLHGYADAKVGALAWAPLWHSMGYNLLVPDLRAHGESGGSACTAGFHERHDLVRVLDELRSSRPEETAEVALFGVSLGAAVAAAVATETGGISAVVMESPYADFRTAARTHMDRLGVPGAWLQTPAIRLAEWLTGADYDAVRPAGLIPRVRCPVLVIQAGNDPFLPPGDVQTLRRAIADRPRDYGPAELWEIDGAAHLMGIRADPEAYRLRVARFLARAAGVTASFAGTPRSATDRI